eukprot:CAMPEP_0197613332 /NCGR_PEP_ID=MMETSP1326-20131121/58963_1 /TAXON_ID=1155430 /ORGANISM="Genus nov. species nov., Strain RCC2288" /LENGTH=325 /DNA_ID=CAMNT_0043182191 /DNA_START=197 /DNA_END=1171 /DNA_ORIENTATION=-
MAQPAQVFVRVLDGSTRCLQFYDDAAAAAEADVEAAEFPAAEAGTDNNDAHHVRVTLGELRRRLFALEGVPASEQLLVCGARVLSGGDHDVLGPADAATGLLPSCTLLLRLVGGKGGFGSLLRGAAKSAKTTTNFDACRDLSGRRLRHVNGERKIIEYAKHAEDRELEAAALAHIGRKDLQIKRKFKEIEEEEKARYKTETMAALENVTHAVHAGQVQAVKLDQAARSKAAEDRAKEQEMGRKMDRMWNARAGAGGDSDSDDDDDSEDDEALPGMPQIKKMGNAASGSGSGGGKQPAAVDVAYSGKGKEPVGVPVTAAAAKKAAA